MATLSSTSELQYLQKEYEYRLKEMQRYYDRQQVPMMAQTNSAVTAQMMYENRNGQIIQITAEPIKEKPNTDEKLKSLIAYYYHR